MLAPRRAAASRRRRSTTCEPVVDADELRAARARGRRDDASATRSSATSSRSSARTRELPSVALGASPRAAVHLLAAAQGRGAARRPRLRDARRRRRAWRPPVLRHRLAARGPRPSSSATGPTTRSRPRSRPCPCRDEPDAARGAALVARRGARALVLPLVASSLLAALAVARGDASSTRSPCARRAGVRARRCRAILARGVAGAARASRPRADAPGRVAAAPAGAARPRDRARARPTARSTRRLVARRRGRHALPAGRARVDGPARARRAGTTAPASDARGRSSTPTCRPRGGSRSPCGAGRFRDPGARARGPLGLGTEFESIRDYQPDDDVRQVNWRATGAARAADEQPVPHRAGPRRRSASSTRAG